jgi:hypothetical protein
MIVEEFSGKGKIFFRQVLNGQTNSLIGKICPNLACLKAKAPPVHPR